MSKDYRYIKKRYFKHPVYHYDIWKIENSKQKSQDILITREEMVGKHKICKIIDFYGRLETLGKIACALDKLMIEKEYEYVDVYSEFLQQFMKKAGLYAARKRMKILFQITFIHLCKRILC